MTYNVFSGTLNPTQSQSALDGSRGEAPSTILRVLCTVDCLVTYLFHDLCTGPGVARTTAVGEC